MSSDHLPLPPAVFDNAPLIATWAQRIIRVHHSQFGATEFNPGRGTGGRFDPLRDRNGRIVPTLYGAGTLDGALSETIFHDVPLRGERRIAISTLMPLQASTLQPVRPLRLVDLRGFGLGRLGLSRRQLIDSDADQYPATRAWAAVLYDRVPESDGMIWVARHHDLSEAVILFGTRVERTEFAVIAPPRPLAPEGTIEPAVIAAASEAGIMITVS